MGDERAVMVTGVLTTWQKLRSSRAIAPVSDPAPTASEAMAMHPTPVLKFKAICRLGRS